MSEHMSDDAAQLVLLGTVAAATMRGDDGATEDEMRRVFDWVQGALADAALADLVLRGRLYATWPEGADEPSFVKPPAPSPTNAKSSED